MAIVFNDTPWSIQRQIGTALSVPRAKVAVPSCNASGKTWLAGRLALTFFYAYTPGEPCVQCGGKCRGSKIITTSSKFEHLRDNLFGELRTAYHRAKEQGIRFPGRLLDGDLRIENGPDHFIIGQSSNSAEGMQGYHAAHKLIIGDEATSVDDAVQLAITRLLASSDSRLLLIYNPTTPDTYASRMARSPGVARIKITAYDTPAFTGEPMPPGANLITPAFLEELKNQGMGPGTFEWETSIMAEDWDQGDDLLIPMAMYEKRVRQGHELGMGTRQLGIDLAVYGSDENVIAVRDGNQLVEMRTFPSMRVDQFFQGPVLKAVLDFQPNFVVWDGDGPGAGAHGYAEQLGRQGPPGMQLIGFRGGKGSAARYRNQRAAWYWHLRQRFERGDIWVSVHDPKLADQLTDIHYSITPEGDIRVETKQEIKKRGTTSPDRADALMYAFAYSDELSQPHSAPAQPNVSRMLGVTDHSERAMWDSIRMRHTGRQDINPVTGIPDW